MSEVPASLFDLCASRIRDSDPYRRLLASPGPIQRLPVPAAAWVLGLASQDLGRPLLVVTPRESDALSWVEAARLLTPEAVEPIYFPAPSLTPYQETEASLLGRAQEAVALDRIHRSRSPAVILTPRALFRRLPKAGGDGLARVLRQGEEIDLDQLARWLVQRGFHRTELVVEVGTFAVRGGVFDLFPPGAARPVRLDLMGDEIESLRDFDPVTQRSQKKLEHVRVRPLSMFSADDESARELADLLEHEHLHPSRDARGLEDGSHRTEEAEEHEELEAELDRILDPDHEIAQRIEALRGGDRFDGWENYLPMLDPETVGPADLIAEPLVVAIEPRVLIEEAEHHQQMLELEYQTRREQGRLAVRPDRLENPLERVLEVLERASAVIDVPVGDENRQTPANVIDFGATTTESLIGQLPRFPREVELARDRGDALVVVSPLRHQAGLVEILEGRDVEVGGRGVQLVDGELERGFRLPLAGLVVYGDSQLLAVRPDRGSSRRSLGPFFSGFRDLKVGEFVVHEDHGIGQYLGMRSLEPDIKSTELPPSLSGMEEGSLTAREVMEIAYAQGKTLLLPLDRLHQIQKYSGVEGLHPKPDRLGGTSWNKKKTKVKRSLKKLATNLIELYAQRELATAPATGADSDAQNQFEAAFEFDETEDQLNAIRDIKADLQRRRPMDRLLCGDVGFGKTEVAMRAAFKMIDHGLQVAILAPTTILADQHLQTFRERFADFPVIIDMVSRFRTAAEVREIKQRVKEGVVDVLIGTHRLLSADIHIPKLGLLIVDEEQRFGVGQKEKLKELKKNVHVLSMSATPVPRTLQLSLAGVREMSTIESPPKDRMAIETRILPFAADLVREAIDFERERGGQIYYVYNRVEDIERISAMLRELVPGLRITVGHGQMDERELLARMRAFKAGEHDLLLATTIIENGIDIPNVNTMIVHRADRFGLAQLYQLRGRVGRSNQLAFCYLLVPSDRILPREARLRLQAIQEFSDLGAGFRIAARDLEIRGAGNLLGAEQSGHISELGIETYMKMLKDTVLELRGQAPEHAPSAQIDLPIVSSIPKSYIADTNLRMEVYRRFSTAEEDIGEIVAELRDRFGPPPRSVHTLASACELKLLAERLRVQSIALKGRRLTIRLRRDAAVDVDRLIHLVSERDGAAFSPKGVLTLEAVPAQQCLIVARQTLEAIAPDRDPAVPGEPTGDGGSEAGARPGSAIAGETDGGVGQQGTTTLPWQVN